MCSVNASLMAEQQRICLQCKRLGFHPWVGKTGGGHGNPPQCSCLENPMDRGAWWAIVRGVAKSWTGLSDSTFFSSKNSCFVSSSSPLLYQFIFNWVLSFLLFILYWSVIASQSCVNSQVYSRGVPFVHNTYICRFSEKEHVSVSFHSWVLSSQEKAQVLPLNLLYDLPLKESIVPTLHKPYSRLLFTYTDFCKESTFYTCFCISVLLKNMYGSGFLFTISGNILDYLVHTTSASEEQVSRDTVHSLPSRNIQSGKQVI